MRREKKIKDKQKLRKNSEAKKFSDLIEIANVIDVDVKVTKSTLKFLFIFN